MTRSVTTGPVTARAVQLLAVLLMSVCSVNPVAATVTCVEDFDRGMTSAARDARPGTPLSAALSQKLDDAVLAALPLAETPGVIVGVQTPDGTWKKGYGVADPATGAPMEPGMHTRIGSVTKTFTGTMLLQLAEAGRLSLDDTIDAYVEGIPNGDRITLRQLADMTSGVASYTASERFVELFLDQPGVAFSPEDLLTFAVENSPLFEPGTQYDYSNTNTILLGMVIEKTTGQPFETSLRKMILEPLGLEKTVWPGSRTELPEPYAQGVTLQGVAATPEAPLVATHWNPASLWTAGELISNLDDLLVYGRALGSGQGLLGTEMQQARLRSFRPPDGYGLALRCNGEWVGHTGEVPGYTTVVFHSPRTDTTLVVQANSDMPSGDCEEAKETQDVDEASGLSCSLPAMRIFNAVAPLVGETAPQNTAE